MNLVIFGPPGAGKGTQSAKLVKEFNLFQLSTGDLLRDEVSKKTDFGNKIEEIMKSGGLVSDEIINNLIENKISNSQNIRIELFLMDFQEILNRLEV